MTLQVTASASPLLRCPGWHARRCRQPRGGRRRTSLRRRQPRVHLGGSHGEGRAGADAGRMQQLVEHRKRGVQGAPRHERLLFFLVRSGTEATTAPRRPLWPLPSKGAILRPIIVPVPIRVRQLLLLAVPEEEEEGKPGDREAAGEGRSRGGRRRDMIGGGVAKAGVWVEGKRVWMLHRVCVYRAARW